MMKSFGLYPIRCWATTILSAPGQGFQPSFLRRRH